MEPEDLKPQDGAANQDPNSQSATGQPPAQSQTQPGQPTGQVPLAALQEERTKRQELQAEVEKLQAMMQINPVQQYQPQYQQPQYQQPQQDFRQQQEELWQNDPQAAFRQELYQALSMRDQVDLNVDTAIQAAKSKYQDFGTYEQEVRRYVKTVPFEQRMNPKVVDAAYFVVRGQKADDTWKNREAELLRKWKAGENVQGLTGSMPSFQGQPDAIRLTEDEEKMRQMYGMTPEEYVNTRKTSR